MSRILLLALIAALVPMAPAWAGLSVCDKTKHPAKVALARFDGHQWTSEGWWTVTPGKCVEVRPGTLDARYYYLYATDGDAGVWDGGTSFCVAASEKFSIPGQGNCAARGYDRKRFFRVDTSNNLNQVQNLE